MATPWSDGLPRARPEAHGIDPARLNGFLEEAAHLGVELHSFMLWRTGHVVAEGWWWPYRADRPHMMHSATKSFLSAAVGLAVAEGRFALSDHVVDFFQARAPVQSSPLLAEMTVEDLLTQTSGHAQGASGSVWRGIRSSWIDEFFKIPVAFEPGTRFRYTSATSFLLSAIISRTTGQTAHDYIGPRLLEPLGIHGLTWDVGPEDINPGGNGISCRTSDLLKLAILHLQGGAWNGDQLLTQDWVCRATAPQRGNPYGYHWWVGPGGSFYAYGVFGQFAFAFPGHDAVLAVTAGVPAGEETLRSLVWHHVPALLDGTPALPTRSGPTGWADLRLPALHPSASDMAGAVSGATYDAAANADRVASLRLVFGAERCVLHLTDDRGDHRVEAGLADWVEGDTTLSGAMLHHGYEPASMRVVAGGTWLAPKRFAMTLQFVETAFRDRIVLEFGPATVTMHRSVNTNSGAVTRPVVLGHRRPS